jgi:hypothetical protein
MKRRELNRIPVDLAYVEVLAYFLNFGGGDMVRSAPYAFGGFMLLLLVSYRGRFGCIDTFPATWIKTKGSTHGICQSLPMRLVDQRDNTSRRLGRSPVIFTISPPHQHIPTPLLHDSVGGNVHTLPTTVSHDYALTSPYHTTPSVVGRGKTYLPKPPHVSLNVSGNPLV